MARKFVSQGAGEIRTSWTRICTSTDENIMEIVEQKFSNQLRAMARKFVSQVRVLFVHQPIAILMELVGQRFAHQQMLM